jgi:hypothetical protein
VIVVAAGRVTSTVQPVSAVAPAVTRMVVTKPPFHWLTDAAAVHPAGGGGVVPPSVRVGVCQSRHSARLPCLRLEIRNVPAELPVPSRYFWMCCCSGVRHSDRDAQCVPSWTSDQYVMFGPAPSAL